MTDPHTLGTIAAATLLGITLAIALVLLWPQRRD